MQVPRRVFFNPTSIPSLRTVRSTRRDFYNAGLPVKFGLGGLRNGLRSNKNGKGTRR